MRVNVILAAALVTTAAAQQAPQKQVVQVPGTVAGLPFSPAVRVGNVIYLSGAIGNLLGTR